MENSKHTKGNWSFGKTDPTNKNLPYTITIGPDDEAKVFGTNKEANAKLIAAAPELLEALQELVKERDAKAVHKESLLILSAKAAIKKATE